MVSDHMESEQYVVPESSKTPFYPALDGLRTLAVALVFGVHLLPHYVPFGWMGVQVFFVLSGFLITGILYDTRNNAHRFRDFYVRRSLRIFPLYYAVLLLLLVVVGLTHGSVPHLFSLSFVYLQNFWWLLGAGSFSDSVVAGSGMVVAAVGHFWSLAVEEQFYLVWPVLVFAIKDRGRLMKLCFALIGLRMLLAAYWQTHVSSQWLHDGLVYRMLPTQCDGFLMGGLLALTLRGRHAPRLLTRAGPIGAAGVCVFAAGLGIVYHWHIFTRTPVSDYTSGFQAVFGLPLCNLASLCLLLAVLRPGTWAYKLCNVDPLRSLGKISYGLYLFHLPILALCQSCLQRYGAQAQSVPHFFLLRALVVSLVTVGISYGSFRFFESPFLLLKNRFSSIKAPAERKAVAHRVS